jgi:hypothetical protein
VYDVAAERIQLGLTTREIRGRREPDPQLLRQAMAGRIELF